jgi:cysteinyl-tRNA synthetase
MLVPAVTTTTSSKEQHPMSLTVAEKEHWKDRISKRIDKKVETLLAAEPNLMDRIHREARQRALQSLGLADWQHELDDIERQKDQLEKRSRRVLKAMLAHVQGVPTEDVEDTGYGYTRDQEIKSAVANRQKVHEDELLAECDTGREILRLRREQEDLLDTVWLATSAAALKALWSKVNELLGTEPTRLERDALAIAPVDAGGE